MKNDVAEFERRKWWIKSTIEHLESHGINKNVFGLYDTFSMYKVDYSPKEAAEMIAYLNNKKN